MKVVSNKLVPYGNAVSSSATWNYYFGRDAEVYMEVADTGSVGDWIVKIEDPDGGHFYNLELINEYSGAGVYEDDTTLRIAFGSPGLSNGDAIGLSIIGDTVSGYKKTSGTWTLMGTWTDTLMTTRTRTQISTGSWNDTGVPNVAFDNFGGGTYVPPAAYRSLLRGKNKISSGIL